MVRYHGSLIQADQRLEEIFKIRDSLFWLFFWGGGGGLGGWVGFGFQALGVKTAPVKLGKASRVSSVSRVSVSYRPTWYTGSSTSSSRMVCVMAGQKADDTVLFFHQ